MASADAVQVHPGDCLDVLRTLPDASVHAVVTDPPYGLSQLDSAKLTTALTAWVNGDRERVPSGKGFMGKEWDAFVPPPAVWDECMRVLKPGGYLACFAAPRTQDLMGLSIRLAGFEIRDSVSWIMGSGFPKSRNVSADLSRLPACRCGVSEVSEGRVSVEQAAVPPGPVGTGVGTEAPPLFGARCAADLADGLRLEPGGSATNRAAAVECPVEDVVRDSSPVMLGAATMAGTAEGEQVVGGVGSVEVEPESLRDEVVGDEFIGRAAISTRPVACDAVGGDIDPATPAVLPLSATPRRVALGGEAAAIVDGHAGSGAVDAGVGPASKLDATDAADVNSVAGRASSHVAQSTTERRDLRSCATCGGRVGEVPTGLGTAMKPAHEPILLARKPLDGTVARNVLAHGTGGINIDGCRVATDEAIASHKGTANQRVAMGQGWHDSYQPGDAGKFTRTDGRFPANVILSHSETCTDDVCDEGCPVAELDAQSGITKDGVAVHRNRPGGTYQAPSAFGTYGNDARADIGYSGSGGASRFFPSFRYQAKAPKSERPKVNGVSHSTVKPLKLMEWLVKLLCPPGGTILDPFAGTGTTLQAARNLGFGSIGIERDGDYLRLIEARLAQPPDDRPALFEAS